MGGWWTNNPFDSPKNMNNADLVFFVPHTPTFWDSERAGYQLLARFFSCIMEMVIYFMLPPESPKSTGSKSSCVAFFFLLKRMCSADCGSYSYCFWRLFFSLDLCMIVSRKQHRHWRRMDTFDSLKIVSYSWHLCGCFLKNGDYPPPISHPQKWSSLIGKPHGSSEGVFPTIFWKKKPNVFRCWSTPRPSTTLNLGDGFKYFLMYTPNPGEDEPILTNMFQMGWFNHQLVKLYT